MGRSAQLAEVGALTPSTLEFNSTTQLPVVTTYSIVLHQSNRG
jgi:hypothetical protein